MLSAVSAQDELRFTLRDGSVNAQVRDEFLKQLPGGARQPQGLGTRLS